MELKRITMPIISLVLMASLAFATGLYAQVKKESGKGHVGDHLKRLELRLERLLQRSKYRYNASGKPDPFRPFIQAAVEARPRAKGKEKGTKGARQGHRTCATPLECLDVGQLTLVGVVEIPQNGGAIAMAQDSSGIGYMIKVGDRIGFNNGRVTAILPDRVVVTEMVEDIEGNIVPRKRVLLLHPEEE